MVVRFRTNVIRLRLGPVWALLIRLLLLMLWFVARMLINRCMRLIMIPLLYLRFTLIVLVERAEWVE